MSERISQTSETQQRSVTPVRIGIVLGLTAIVLGLFSVSVIETGQAGVVTRTGSDQTRVISTPGVYVRLPFIERVWLIDTRLKTTVQTELQTITTSDQQSLRVSGWMAWHVTDPARFQAANADKQPIDGKLLKILGDVLPTWVATQRAEVVLKGQADNISKALLADLNQRLDPFGVSAVQVGLQQTELSESATQKITERMSATKNRHIKQLNEALITDERQLASATNRTQAQVLDEAYRAAQKTRQNAEQLLLAAYSRQYGSSNGFVDVLRAPARATEKPGNEQSGNP